MVIRFPNQALILTKQSWLPARSLGRCFTTSLDSTSCAEQNPLVGTLQSKLVKAGAQGLPATSCGPVLKATQTLDCSFCQLCLPQISFCFKTATSPPSGLQWRPGGRGRGQAMLGLKRELEGVTFRGFPWGPKCMQLSEIGTCAPHPHQGPQAKPTLFWASV